VLKIGLAVATALALAAVGCGGGGPAGTGTTRDGFEGAAFPPGVPAPDFTLHDQAGQSVSLSTYKGRMVVVIAFLSTRCRACMLMAQQVRGALDELASTPTYGRGTAQPAMLVLFVSTSPRTDTKASVRRFLAETSLSSRVLFLTGSQAQLRAVWRAYRIPPPIVDRRDRRSASAGKSASEAAITVLLIGPSGNERVGFGLEQVTPESLAHDIRLLRDGRATPAG
jgi:cytochrome oxidase Cu insertion factor (SCO1/SenC/PrrC family)